MATSPFLIACGFHKPHIPFLAPDAYFKAYPKETLRFTLDPTNDWSDIPAIADTKQYLDYGFPAKGREDAARRREFTQAYYACISFVDAQLGIIIDALKQSGQWVSRIVFIGDNDYDLGEHFMWGKVMPVRGIRQNAHARARARPHQKQGHRRGVGGAGGHFSHAGGALLRHSARPPAGPLRLCR